MHFIPERLLSLVRGLVLLLAAGTAAHADNGPIDFAYDELGRLVGLSDRTGAGATYTYDALGNILSITNAVAGQVAIMEFTPDGGPVGATVTIFGTGFSATAAANTVRFNGVAATVLSATATQLVANVPAGATTGPISVTSPAGTATSSANFTVTAATDPQAPTISGFTPTIAASGTTVTISGTNFETETADKIRSLSMAARRRSVRRPRRASRLPFLRYRPRARYRLLRHTERR